MTTLQQALAPSITKAASRQTYYTIRFLADRERVADAYRAYAYFRWVDDTLDASETDAQKRIEFLEQQKYLLEKTYQGVPLQVAATEENMLIELIQQDGEHESGLQVYLGNMMRVMDFDARRRGTLISHFELNEYTRWLASAVTEAMHYFIGHDSFTPHDETRYLAVTAAHITHMLRDTFDDIQVGYYNIPRETLEAGHIQPQETLSRTYQDWVRSRVRLARRYFKAGREYFDRIENPRCRLAGYAYIARFEWLLDTFEREDYFLRPEYKERKSMKTGLRMGLQTLLSLVHLRERQNLASPVVSRSIRKP
ncbi:MAG TPA: squalene/phytoene synthase family protein [Anaerolineales bacterium]|nr:squalene/phytoene synthase family protein [Anaerolineales bacterium]